MSESRYVEFVPIPPSATDALFLAIRRAAMREILSMYSPAGTNGKRKAR